MINPEFKRNLWLQFSLHRMIAMPAILGLIFIAVHLGGSNEKFNALGKTAIFLFIIIVSFWGTRNASASVIDEFRDKTWDQQRMSAMQPWAMTWSKLFGATAFNWYGGVLCIAVIVASHGARGDGAGIVNALTLVAASILMHALVIALNLHMGRIEARIIARGGVGGVVILLALIVFSILGNFRGGIIRWWGGSYSQEWFFLASAILFAACAVFAAWRVMCNELQLRTLPWAWPAFALILTTYIAGFIGTAELPAFPMIAVLVATLMTYCALFSESNDVAVWRRVVARAKARDWQGMLEHLPLWPTTLLLLLVFAAELVIGNLASGAGAAIKGDRPGELALLFLPQVIALMVVRDIGVFLFFAFSDKPKRAEATTLLYLVVINLLLPFISKSAGLDWLTFLLLPFDPASPLLCTLVMAAHAAIAATLAWRRWRQHRIGGQAAVTSM